ncbi:MAG: protein kinase [Polyangiaceae bacterium]|nr:protein kinase [Polyangiaceae bacterium]
MTYARGPIPLDTSPSERRDVRCPICGRRVPASGCPEHRPQGTAPSAPEKPVSAADLPSFPGYRVLGILGRGGFGTVFEAARESDGARVAIKLARTDRIDAAARLDRERNALLTIGPPHVPTLHAVGEIEPGAPYLVMDRIRAEPLSVRFLEARSMSLPDVAAAASAILKAIEAIHAAGFAHGDLKPENILILMGKGAAPQATIIDFGLATPLGRKGSSAAVAPDNTIFGTAEYMSPEQCDEHPTIDARSDIYAMGILIYEMVAGRPPFWGSAALVRQSHRARRPQRPSALALVPPAVEEVILRCLAKDPNDRFASAAELREALEQAFDERSSHPYEILGAPPSVPPSSEGPPPSSATRERRYVSLVAFESNAEVMIIERRLLLLGGQLAHAASGGYVAVFTQELGQSPAQLALRAAHELVKLTICERALVDRAPLSIRTRPDGSKMFLSPFFGRLDRFPTPSDPAGVLVSPAAARALGDVHGAIVPGRDWVLVGSAREAAAVETTTQSAATKPLFGHVDLVAKLLEGAAKAAKTRTPTITAVIGEPGYGKTHLGAALVERLRARAARRDVIELRARGVNDEGSGRLLRDLLQAALEAPDTPPEDGGKAFLTERLGALRGAELWPAAALGLGWMSPDAPALRALETAPGALQAALVAATGVALQRRAARAALFVLLDDAHLADDATLLALEHAALGENQIPIWVCGLARPAFEQAHATWGERAGARTLLRLPALDRTSAAELCRHLLRPAESVPDRAIDLLIDRAGGAPLLLVELIRGVKRAGMVRRPPGGGAFFLAADELDKLPDMPLIEWVAEREIDALSPAQKAHARLLSLLGSEVLASDVEGILRKLDAQGAGNDFPLDAGAAAKQLIAAGLVLEPERGRIRFRHALIGEALARSVSEAFARRVHLAALQHYWTGNEEPNEHRLAGVARHAAAAGLPSVAESALMALAERARARQIYLDAEQLYSRAIAISTAPPAAAYRSRGLMRYRLARFHDALADFSKARALSQARGDTVALIEILLDEATALDWMDDYKTSAARVREARELSTGRPSPSLEARLLLGMGRALHRESREEEASRFLEEAAELASEVGDEGYETLVISLFLLGFTLQGLGRLKDAARALDRSIALCEEHRDRLHLGPAMNIRGLLRGCLGDKAGMVADLTRVGLIGRELGQGMLEIVAHYNLGEYLYLMNDLDAAEPHVKAAIAIDLRSGREVRPLLSLLEARLRLFRGDRAAAGEIVRDIRTRGAEVLASGGDVPLSPSEDVLCSMVELSARDAGETEWEALIARSSACSVGQEKIEVLEMAAHAALRLGRREAARARIGEALAAAATIPNAMGERLQRLKMVFRALPE